MGRSVILRRYRSGRGSRRGIARSLSIFIAAASRTSLSALDALAYFKGLDSALGLEALYFRETIVTVRVLRIVAIGE